MTDEKREDHREAILVRMPQSFKDRIEAAIKRIEERRGVRYSLSQFVVASINYALDHGEESL